ncbi:hypothetical protein ACIGEZ_19825 [Streptomyces sp. NPDC085481]|uniref:hypothetical protein n=1 Tax=Streptomyces sp. NPDC085481 TaxID=3365727 RepID=UPI0037CCD308
MTRDRKRKAEIRAAQQTTGRRYTQAAHALTKAPRQVERAFLLKELLTECSTQPPADVDWGYPDEFAPRVFESALLGTVVPYGTVLELAGTLAQEGTDARLRVESVSPLEGAVIRCSERRLSLVLSQDMIRELCQEPGCTQSPIRPFIIVRCPDHLADCDANALAAMASAWGYALHDELDRTTRPASVAASRLISWSRRPSPRACSTSSPRRCCTRASRTPR